MTFFRRIGTRAAAVIGLLCSGLPACDPGNADAAPACDSESGVADTRVPIAVDCSFVFAGVQTDVTYR